MMMMRGCRDVSQSAIHFILHGHSSHTRWSVSQCATTTIIMTTTIMTATTTTTTKSKRHAESIGQSRGKIEDEKDHKHDDHRHSARPPSNNQSKMQRDARGDGYMM